jgi:two-component system CheB/CheR fusion protein
MLNSTKARKADLSTASETDMAQRPVRVLLVEDDEDDYRLTRDLLQEIGEGRFVLEWVPSYAAAVEVMPRQEHDVYLVDYRLGPHDGLELLNEPFLVGKPVIMLTGLDDRDVDLKAMAAGAADYLVKGKIDAPLLERSIRYAIERKRAEEALKDADRRKDEFLAMLGHELRNPLAAIRYSLQILLSSKGKGDVAPQVTEIIDTQVYNLTRMVDDLLDVSRITRGNIQLRKDKAELAMVIGQAVESARPLIEARSHKLTVALTTQPVHLEADPTRLEQVLVNLLNNAAKYTKPCGDITLTAEREGDEAVIRVQDNGIGIQPELLPKVFDLFVQSEQSQERSQGGLGIGLTLVKKLVEMHGGRIEAHSEGVDKGSEFVVRLPALPSDGSEPEAPSEQNALASGKLRVEVVEDAENVAQSLKMLLEFWGHDVRVVHDGQAALVAYRTYQPDVILLDIGLPGMNGYDVARQLRREQGEKKPLIVALTGYGQDEDMRQSQKAGFDYHMTKPVEPYKLQTLLASVHHSCRNSKSSQAQAQGSGVL